MMGKERQSVGRKGEELAARYLAEKGFRVLERNYRAYRGEIDIIALGNLTYVARAMKLDSE